jgi:hypothetical protein
MIKPKVVLLIFVSGKIVLTGAKVTDFRCQTGFLLQILTFPSACKGTRGDLYSVQHDLHRAMRVPQAVTTAWSATPLCLHAGGSAKLLFTRLGTCGIPSDLSTLAERLPVIKKLAFQRLHTCTLIPISPYPARIYWQIPYYKVHIRALRPSVLVIALSMTVYSEAFNIGRDSAEYINWQLLSEFFGATDFTYSQIAVLCMAPSPKGVRASRD